MGQGQSNTGAATNPTQRRRRGSNPESAAANRNAVEAQQPTNTGDGDSVMRSQLEGARKNGFAYQQRLEQERLERERLERERLERERLERERRTAEQERAALAATQGRVGPHNLSIRNAGLIPKRRTHKYKSRKNRSRKLRK